MAEGFRGRWQGGIEAIRAERSFRFKGLGFGA